MQTVTHEDCTYPAVNLKLMQMVNVGLQSDSLSYQSKSVMNFKLVDIKRVNQPINLYETIMQPINLRNNQTAN